MLSYKRIAFIAVWITIAILLAFLVYNVTQIGKHGLIASPTIPPNATLLTINLAQNAPTGQYTIKLNTGQVKGTDMIPCTQSISLENNGTQKLARLFYDYQSSVQLANSFKSPSNIVMDK